MGKILWLASYPRSGNTWLRAFLHNLLRDPPAPYDINRLQDFTLIDSDARWYRTPDAPPPNELTKEEVAALRPLAHEAMTRAFPDTVFVKTHNALVEDRGTPMVSLAHTAGAIYVVRNPLDVAVSYSDHYGVSLDEAISAMNRIDNQSVGNQANFVYELHGSWSQNVASWTASPNPALHVVRYEDLVSEAIPTFRRITEFLGIRASAERIMRAVEFSSFRVLSSQEALHGFIERSRKSMRFFRAGQVGQGRRALSAHQIEAIVSANREQMARFGYRPLPAAAAAGS
jgi:hypothetical protein